MWMGGWVGQGWTGPQTPPPPRPPAGGTKQWPGPHGCISGEGASEEAPEVARGWLDRRLKEVAKAVGGGYCRLQMPLKSALAVRDTVAGRWLGALERGGGGFPMHPPPPLHCLLDPAFPFAPPPPPLRSRPKFEPPQREGAGRGLLSPFWGPGKWPKECMVRAVLTCAIMQEGPQLKTPPDDCIARAVSTCAAIQ